MSLFNPIEELRLRVEQYFEEGNYTEGCRVLEEILDEEPGYGVAHNFLGWVYYNKFENAKRAMYHYRLAIRFAPNYAPAYVNLSYVLIDNKMYEEATANANAALKVPSTDAPVIWNELGRIAELTGNYREAVKHYREAIRLSLNQHYINVFTKNMERAAWKRREYAKSIFLF